MASGIETRISHLAAASRRCARRRGEDLVQRRRPSRGPDRWRADLRPHRSTGLSTVDLARRGGSGLCRVGVAPVHPRMTHRCGSVSISGRDAKHGSAASTTCRTWCSRCGPSLRTTDQSSSRSRRSTIQASTSGVSRASFRLFRSATETRGTWSAKALQTARRVVRRNSDPPFGIDRAARGGRVDVLFPTLRASRWAPPVLPWVYDLQHLDQPDLFSARERSFRTRAFRRAARSGRVVVLSSEAMADAFVARFPEAVGKVRVLRFTTVPGRGWLAADPAEVRRRYRLPGGFLLLPGQLWVHKDHLTAFAALRRLRDLGENRSSSHGNHERLSTSGSPRPLARVRR